MPTDLAPLWLSLRVATLATLAIVMVGMPLALVLARGRFPGKGLLAGVLVLPLVLPPTVLGYGLLQVLGRRAAVGMWLEATLGGTVVFHWAGAVIASAGGGVPPVPAAGARGDRGGGPGAGGRGPAAGAARVVGLAPRDDPPGLARPGL